MAANGSAESAVDCVYRAVEAAMLPSVGPVRAIGVSSPGPLDPKTGVILQTPNLPCWRNFPLLRHIEERYGLPTRLENDANAAGLAEALWGAASDFSSVFYVTIGTGIGTAIIYDKHIYHGRTGAAAEGGHMTIDFKAPIKCGCGKHGCLESMASGPAIAARAREKLLAAEFSKNNLDHRSDPRTITAETICDACDAGDAFALGIMQETVELLAIWMGNVIDLLEPEVIVIGGGLGARITKWLPQMESSLLRWTINTRANEIPLLLARYGADSGIAGSAALWLSELTTRVPQAASKVAE
jgi:glucokinase